uniref:Secreted protein n=1 Tax=Vespula pensylvanica TaxID=30213 RepID=A0A834P0E6_VESPE|nr:hypothetical protein H0235_008568 [Vespula pensylvanica]
MIEKLIFLFYRITLITIIIVPYQQQCRATSFSTYFNIHLLRFQPTTDHPSSMCSYIQYECFGAIAELLK